MREPCVLSALGSICYGTTNALDYLSAEGQTDPPPGVRKERSWRPRQLPKRKEPKEVERQLRGREESPL